VFIQNTISWNYGENLVRSWVVKHLRGCTNKHGASHNISMESEKKLIKPGLKCPLMAQNTTKQTMVTHWKQ